MMDAEPSGLKASLIHQTEQAIDGLRKRREMLEPELAEIAHELEEARNMLQLLKNGTVSVPQKPKRTLLNETDAREVLEFLDREFTTHDYAEAAEITRGAAANWCKRFMDECLVVVSNPLSG
jgi:hypothetical protein